MLLVDVLLELVAAVLAVGAVRALVLRLAAALQRHVAHQVLARVVAALALGAAVALLSLVLRALQPRAGRRQDVVGRRLAAALAALRRAVGRRLGRHLGRRLRRYRLGRFIFQLFVFFRLLGRADRRWRG